MAYEGHRLLHCIKTENKKMYFYVQKSALLYLQPTQHFLNLFNKSNLFHLETYSVFSDFSGDFFVRALMLDRCG